MNGITLIATSLYTIFKDMEKKDTTPMVTIPLSEYERMREEISNKEITNQSNDKKWLIAFENDILKKIVDKSLKENHELENEIEEMNVHIKFMTRQRDKFLRITYVEGIIIVILAACCAVLMH